MDKKNFLRLLNYYIGEENSSDDLIEIKEVIDAWEYRHCFKKIAKIKELLVTMDNIRDLVSLFPHTSRDEEIWNLIKNRIDEILPQITDLDILLELSENYSYELGNKLEVKIIEKISMITDIYYLIELLNDGFARYIRRALQERIGELIPDALLEITDLDKLIDLLKKGSLDSDTISVVTPRIIEILSDISNMTELMDSWSNLCNYGVPREIVNLFENRMKEILQTISISDPIDNIPDWFVKILRRKKSLPNSLVDDFYTKVKEFQQVLQ